MQRATNSLLGSLPVDEMEGPYSARLPSSSIGEKSRRAPVGRGTAEQRDNFKHVGSGLMSFKHEPVMLEEVLGVFEPIEAGVIVDATVGGGGHARALLDSHKSIHLVGLDRDPEALAAAARNLQDHRSRVELRHARFDQIATELDGLGVGAIVGVLFDLGVSSHQLDSGRRGFSFRHDGPLDMRMDQTDGRSAALLIDEASELELAQVLSDLGDERHARRIAKAILANRPFETTTELAEVVAEAMPAASRRQPGHPARRTFQALRIAVNDELAAIAPAIEQSIDRLDAGGRGAVLAYHSGEDRIVKRTLRDAAGLGGYRPVGLPERPADAAIELLHRPGRTPTPAEVERNPRASAARLRSFVRSDTVTS